MFPAKTRPKAFSEPTVESPVLLRAFYKLSYLAVSDVFVQRAGDKYERVPALRSSPAGLNSAKFKQEANGGWRRENGDVRGWVVPH